MGFAFGEYESGGARGKTIKGRILRWSQGPGPYRTHTSALTIPPTAKGVFEDAIKVLNQLTLQQGKHPGA